MIVLLPISHSNLHVSMSRTQYPGPRGLVKKRSREDRAQAHLPCGLFVSCEPLSTHAKCPGRPWHASSSCDFWVAQSRKFPAGTKDHSGEKQYGAGGEVGKHSRSPSTTGTVHRRLEVRDADS